MLFSDKKLIITDNFGKEHVVADKVKLANTFYSRLMGLMGQKTLPERHALILVPCNSIHMMFMHFPIDVVYVRKDFNIIKVVKNIKPWHFDMGDYKAKYTIELPAGTIDFEAIKLKME